MGRRSTRNRVDEMASHCPMNQRRQQEYTIGTSVGREEVSYLQRRRRLSPDGGGGRRWTAHRQSDMSSSRTRRRSAARAGLCLAAGLASQSCGVVMGEAGNCVAGGSGHGVAFDWTRSDTIGLRWDNVPPDYHTVEYWFSITDDYLDGQTLEAYSVFLPEGREGNGDPLESDNEVVQQLGYYDNEVKLWRGFEEHEKKGVEQVESASGWHHYACSLDTTKGEVAMYVDGEQLDLGYAAIKLVEEGVSTDVDYNTASFSAKWDVEDHDDSADYFGTNTREVFLASNPPCDEANSRAAETFADRVVMLAYDDRCSFYEQATNAEELGAWAVMIMASDEKTASLTEDTNATALAIPVVTVSQTDGTNLALVGSVTFVRLRQAIYPEDSTFSKRIEPGGVLHFGQEADQTWGGFDQSQSANGVLDEFRVWGTVRTPEEIKANYRRSVSSLNETGNTSGLNLYWKFDEVPSDVQPIAVDYSGNGNDGTYGKLPTLKNQFEYAMVFERRDGLERTRSPTSPERITTSACPLVGDAEVIVPVTPGQDTTFELKSFDPDGDDLITKIVSLPGVGELYPVSVGETSGPLTASTEVSDGNRTESKRVIFRAPANFQGSTAFSYSVQDGGEPVIASVLLIEHVVSSPANKTITIKEDELTFIALSKPSQLTQMNMRVEITRLPEKGQMFQAQFSEEFDYKQYLQIAHEVDEFGPMEKIDVAPSLVNDTRGVVHYIPDKDEFSADGTNSSVYASFSYRFVDPSGLKSVDGVISIIVEAVNDAPQAQSPPEVSVPVDDNVVIQLEDADIDAGLVERTFAKIKTFPAFGQLYHYDESAVDSLGGPVVDKEDDSGILTSAYATDILRVSSQWSDCGPEDACQNFWNNPACTSNDLKSGGNMNGTCTSQDWHVSSLLGEPDVYPEYSDSTDGWDFSDDPRGHEWVEIQFPFASYVLAFDLYETFGPGAVWKVSTTDEYLDDRNAYCTGVGALVGIEGVPECTTKTNWTTLWTTPIESLKDLEKEARIFSPPLCPSAMKTSIIRLDMDSSKISGWSNYDAAYLTGSLTAPRGLLKDPLNRVVFKPKDGVHGRDNFTFEASDCIDTGDEAEVKVEILHPPAGTFSSSTFSSQEAVLGAEANVVIDYNLDLTAALVQMKKQLNDDPSATGKVHHTTALGESGDTTFRNISLSNPNVTIQLGVADHVGESRMEFWLNDQPSNFTFRLNINVSLYVACVNGNVNEEGTCICSSLRWTEDDCSVERVEDKNLIHPAARGVCYGLFGIIGLTIILSAVFIHVKREERVVKAAQPFFLYLLLVGSMITATTIIPLGQEESDIACMFTPWLYSIGFSVMFGSLLAKIFRVYKVFRLGKKMRKKAVPIFHTLKLVIILVILNGVVLIAWTVVDPLVWVRDDTLVTTDGYVLESVGACKSNNIAPYIGALAAIQIGLLAFAAILCYVSRDIPTDFAEGKHLAFAILANLQSYIVGVPVLIIVRDSYQIAFVVACAVIFVIVMTVIGVMVGRLVFAVFNPEQEVQGSFVDTLRRRTRESNMSSTATGKLGLGSNGDHSASVRKSNSTIRFSNDTLGGHGRLSTSSMSGNPSTQASTAVGSELICENEPVSENDIIHSSIEEGKPRGEDTMGRDSPPPSPWVEDTVGRGSPLFESETEV